MKVLTTDIEGVLVFEPRIFEDARGYFFEVYHQGRYREAGVAEPFVQDNQSLSRRGTVRGLHAQRDHPQGKLVRAVVGEIWDVAVDLRPGSATWGRWVGVELSASNFRQIWVPPGFAHGFCVTSDEAVVEYKCTDLYRPDDEIGIVWNDPDLAIAWPAADPIVSAKDRALPRLADLVRSAQVNPPR